MRIIKNKHLQIIETKKMAFCLKTHTVLNLKNCICDDDCNLLTCFGNVLTDTMAASVSSRRNRSNLKLFDRYSSLSSQLRLRHNRRVKMLVLTRDLLVHIHTYNNRFVCVFFFKRKKNKT